MTAEMIGAECSIDISIEEDIMECNNGLLAGLKREEGIKRYPISPGGRKAHDKYAGTESYIEFRARAETYLSKLLSSRDGQPDRRICIVSHGRFINMLFRSFFRLPQDLDTSISSGDTGIHLWQLNYSVLHETT